MPHDWIRGELDTEPGSLSYWRTGGDEKPKILLVHGFSDSGLCWAPVARGLEDRYDLVMPDMPGHGLSFRPERGLAPDMAAVLAELILSLGLERPVVVGHSMGAMVSAELAARRPELARALVLEDPPWFPAGARPVPAEGEPHPIAAWAKSLERRSLDELLVEYRREHPAWPEDLVRAMCEAKKRLDPGIIDSLDLLLGSRGQAWPSVLRSISVPLLVLTGDPRLGAIVTPETAARVRELRPETQLVPVGGVGHLIRFDEPRAFMDALRSFLERLEA
jgi:N-formylmaleamate deformylase